MFAVSLETNAIDQESRISQVAHKAWLSNCMDACGSKLRMPQMLVVLAPYCQGMTHAALRINRHIIEPHLAAAMSDKLPILTLSIAIVGCLDHTVAVVYGGMKLRIHCSGTPWE